MDFKDFFKNKPWKQWDKTQWTILILLGILLMVVAIPTGGKDEQETPVMQQEEQIASYVREDYAGSLERRLTQVLSKIEGAGRVEVMITLQDYGEMVVEKDTDRNISQNIQQEENAVKSSDKTETVEMETVYQDGDKGKEPFVGSERAPKVEGVLVIAQGADATVVKQNISDAIMALFQIDVNRIKVVKMNVQEERQ